MRKPAFRQETPDELIARYGWMLQGVEGDPNFVYTVGLASKSLPELITFSMSPDTARFVLNDLGRRLTGLRRGIGNVVPINQRLTDILDGADAMLIPCIKERADIYLCQALYRYPDYHALQLVWADPGNKFPWEEGYQARFIRLQPLLGPAPGMAH